MPTESERISEEGSYQDVFNHVMGTMLSQGKTLLGVTRENSIIAGYVAPEIGVVGLSIGVDLVCIPLERVMALLDFLEVWSKSEGGDAKGIQEIKARVATAILEALAVRRAANAKKSTKESESDNSTSDGVEFKILGL